MIQWCLSASLKSLPVRFVKGGVRKGGMWCVEGDMVGFEELQDFLSVLGVKGAEN
jgi:hypothetical protein